MPSPTPTVNPCVEVITFNNEQIQLTPVAVQHLRVGDRLYGVNASGGRFRRLVISSRQPLLSGEWQINLDSDVRETSGFPLPRLYRTSEFFVDRNMIVLAQLGGNHATG